MSSEYYCKTQVIPLIESHPRPLWSVMIPTYNCSSYLYEVLKSVLDQDLGSEAMQIEVIDDCSNLDDPAKVVEQLARNRVEFFRQPQNQGHIENFNTCLTRSRGELIHLLHGDDFVAPNFYTKMQQLFEANPALGAAFCRYTYVGEDGQPSFGLSELEQEHSGVLNDWLCKITSNQRIQPPSMVVRREVYEALGGFDRRICCCGEDWEMWIRIASHYTVGYEPEPLAFYRMQTKSLTGKCSRSGQNIRDIVQIMEIISEYLPKNQKHQLLRQAKRDRWEYYLYTFIPNCLEQGDLEAVINQLKEIPKLNLSLKSIWKILKILLELSIKKSLMLISKSERGGCT